MKKLILIFFAAILFFGCKKEAINPDCTHGPVFFAGNVAGEKMCLAYLLADDVYYHPFQFGEGGTGTDWWYKQATFAIASVGRNGNDSIARYASIVADKIPAADFNLENLTKMLTAGKKKFRNQTIIDPTSNAPVNMGGWHNHGWEITIHTFSDKTLTSGGGPQDEGSILEITKVEKVPNSPNTFDISFFVRCKLYGDNDVYEGMLEDGEMRIRYTFEP